MYSYVLNGQTLQAEKVLHLEELLSVHGFQSGEVAVAVNECFIPRSQYEKFRIEDGHRIEILEPMQGG